METRPAMKYRIMVKARRNYKQGIIGELENWNFESNLPKCGSWCRQIIPLHDSMGKGGSVYSVEDSAKRGATKLMMYAEATGYAYSPKGFTTILSIAILLVYSCIVLTHWVYMIWVKESSNSWRSSSEIAALAMNSRPTKRSTTPVLGWKLPGSSDGGLRS